MRTIVVCGASLAGLHAAEGVRDAGFDGRLVVVGAEPHDPYDRPPLSKQVLTGEWEPERTRLDRLLDGLDAELHLGVRAVSLDTSDRRVSLSDGSRLDLDGLVVATGAEPRRLPGTPDLEGIHVLRTLDDALAIRAALESGPRVAVVGAGFIGLEVAASCRTRGLEVTVVEAMAVPLAHAVGAEVGRALARVHQDHGVDVRCGLGVAGFEGSERVEGVRLADGSVVPADLVVVGIGVAACTGWLEGSGVACDDGVLCDATGATSVPGVVAAGDVARWDNPLYGRPIRVEHWTNAVERGRLAGMRLVREDVEPDGLVPSFWSDQYDRRIRSVGHLSGGEDAVLVQGSYDQDRFLVCYGRDGGLVAALSMNRARPLARCEQAIASGAAFDTVIAEAKDW